MQGIDQCIGWIRDPGDVHDCFAEAEKVLRKKRIMHDIGFIDS